LPGEAHDTESTSTNPPLFRAATFAITFGDRFPASGTF
jgi:hypothetical protein